MSKTEEIKVETVRETEEDKESMVTLPLEKLPSENAVEERDDDSESLKAAPSPPERNVE